MTTQTYIEKLISQACERNTPVLPVDNSQVVITQGPIRLANRNPAALVDLAKNVLQGSASKEIKSLGIAATPADAALLHTTTVRACGLLLRIAGAPNTFRRGPVSLKVLQSGTAVASGKVTNGVAITTFTIYPAAADSLVFVLLTNDNGGVGQVAAPTGIGVEWELDDHPGTTASEYVVSSEVITLRDFTTRENV